MTDLETGFIRRRLGRSGAHTFRQPGIYAYVTHDLIEAVELGATAHWSKASDDDLMKQVTPLEPILTTQGSRALISAPAHRH